MILTCPRCATRYLVDADQLWTTGRTVQCDACGQRWRAAGAGERPPPPPAPQPPLPVPEPLPPAEPQPEPVPETEAEAEAEAVYPPPAAAEVVEEAASALFIQPTRRSPPVRARSPWFGPALSILFLLGMAIAVMLLFQEAVVHAFPGMAGVYSTLGLTKLSLTGGGANG